MSGDFVAKKSRSPQSCGSGLGQGSQKQQHNTSPQSQHLILRHKAEWEMCVIYLVLLIIVIVKNQN
jgi:hypothetical protein